MARAILLLSGGLDSTLAGKMLLKMGIDVEAVNFVSPFCRCTPKRLGCPAAKKAAEQLGIPVRLFACGEEYLKVVKRPRFGRGSGMNPCLDCRIHIFSQARDYMRERGADFVATGEVLGERPMSQTRRAMQIIERESGLEGLIVRPLTGQLLPPSLVERRGLVPRDRLGAIRGRSRLPQIRLASELGISDYLCPAGGCLLTDREFAARFADLLEHDPDFGMEDVPLLRLGRHFRLPNGTKVVVGRNEPENNAIYSIGCREADFLLVPVNIPGPTALCRDPSDGADLATAAGLVATYTKRGQAALDVEVRKGPDRSIFRIITNVAALESADIARWKVAASRKKAFVQEAHA